MPLGEVVVIVQPRQQPPRPPGVVRGQRKAEFRLQFFQLMLAERADDVRVDRVEVDLGVVPVAGERPDRPPQAPAQQRHGIRGHQVDALRVGLERVGEELHVGHPTRVHPPRRQRGHVVGRDGQVLAQSDAVPQFDVVVVQSDGQGAQREDRAQGKRDGRLRAERFGALVAGNRVVRGQDRGFDEVAVVAEDGGGVAVAGLPDGRGAKAGADRAAQGQDVSPQVPPRRQLAVQRLADAFVMLEPARGVDQDLLDDVGFQVEIRAEAAPVGLRGLLGPDAGIARHADAESLPREAVRRPARAAFAGVVDAPRARLSGFDLELLLAVFQAERHVQRGREQADVERPRQVEIERLVAFRVRAHEGARRDVRPEPDQLRIHVVPEAVAPAVPAEDRARVVVPAVEQRRGAPPLAAQPERQAPVFGLGAQPRGEAARKRLGQRMAVVLALQRGQRGRAALRVVAGENGGTVTGPAVRRQVGDQHGVVGPAPGRGEHAGARDRTAPVPRVRNLALRPVAERVRMVGVAQVEADVAEELVVVFHVRRAPRLHRRPADVVVAVADQIQRVAALHAAVGGVGIRELEAQVGEAGVGQRQAEVGRGAHQVAVAVVVLPPAGFERAALGRVAQHEVEHAGHGVGAVLGRGAVAQHFHPFERDGRDGTDVGPVRPVGHPEGEEADRGGAVPAFAVDQHERGIRRQAAQLGRADQRVDVADGVLADVVGRHGRGQQAVHVAHAVVPETVGLDHVHGHGRIRGRAARQPRPDHLEGVEVDGGRLVVRGSVGFVRGRFGVLRRGRRRAQQEC